MTTWISGTNGIVKKADVKYVFSSQDCGWNIYAKTNADVDVLLYAGLDSKFCEKYIKNIMEELEKVEKAEPIKKKVRVQKNVITPEQKSGYNDNAAGCACNNQSGICCDDHFTSF